MALVILSEYKAILEDIEPVKLNKNPTIPVVSESEEMLEVSGWGIVTNEDDDDDANNDANNDTDDVGGYDADIADALIDDIADASDNAFDVDMVGFNPNLPCTLSVGYVPNENNECSDPEFEIKSSMMCASSSVPGADSSCTFAKVSGYMR